ncbi:MAG: hypothetical protein ACPHY8_04005, partial [Patescibacteria group bacterium]
KEFTDYTTALLLNIGVAAGTAVKIEKYDYSQEEEQINPEEFIINVTNNLVSLDILFSRLY